MVAGASFLRRFMFLIITATAASVATAVSDQFLDVGTLTPKIYLGSLGGYVGGLAANYSRNVPVLPVTVRTSNPPTFNFVLKTSEHQISVRIRADNLHVIGYRMHAPEKWLEFGAKSTDPHLIAGSEFLGFGGGYEELEHVANTNLADVSCAKSDFINAVNELAVTAHAATRAKSLMLILQMIVEAARFQDVEYLLANNFYNPSCRLKAYMVDPLLKNWENYSTMILRATDDPCYKYVPPKVEGDVGDTLEKLRNRFGIMYRDPITLKPPCNHAAALN